MASSVVKRIRELEKSVDSNVQNTKGSVLAFFLRYHRHPRAAEVPRRRKERNAFELPAHPFRVMKL